MRDAKLWLMILLIQLTFFAGVRMGLPKVEWKRVISARSAAESLSFSEIAYKEQIEDKLANQKVITLPERWARLLHCPGKGLLNESFNDVLVFSEGPPGDESESDFLQPSFVNSGRFIPVHESRMLMLYTEVNFWQREFLPLTAKPNKVKAEIAETKQLFEKLYPELVEKQQREAWANVFGVLDGILALVALATLVAAAVACRRTKDLRHVSSREE